METKFNIQHNKLIHLEDSVVMYGVYNAETLENLINTVNQMHNAATPNERLLTGKIKHSLYFVSK